MLSKSWSYNALTSSGVLPWIAQSFHPPTALSCWSCSTALSLTVGGIMVLQEWHNLLECLVGCMAAWGHLATFEPLHWHTAYAKKDCTLFPSVLIVIWQEILLQSFAVVDPLLFALWKFSDIIMSVWVYCFYLIANIVFARTHYDSNSIACKITWYKKCHFYTKTRQ
jgi:hypothetical protein